MSTLLPLHAAAEPGVGTDTVVIGQSVVLSGPMEENGIQYTRGIRLYLDQVNGKGGVNGRRIQLVTLDDAYDPKRAEENTRKLLQEHQAFALFGYAGTGSTLAALPLAEKAGSPFLAPYSGADVLRSKPSPVLFHLRPSYGNEMNKIVEHLVTLGIQRIALAYQNDNFGKAGQKSFEDAMARFKLKPTAVAAIDPINLDARATVAALRLTDPAAVVLATAGQGTVAVVREYQKAGNPPQFFGLSVASAALLRRELGGNAAGIVIAQVVPSPWSRGSGVVRQYRDALGNGEPHHASLEGYIAARVLVEGLRRSGKDLTRGKFIAALENLRQFDLGDYTIDFRPGQHSGSAFIDLSILRGDGQFIQ
ncbi:ABC transporter substrate-binding protein [Oryzomicrobium terrae]|nr:ABC transporter substrate-binding protein [Oryzomicrobium terrae]